MRTKIYPLKFDPIYQYRLWGGTKLAKLLPKSFPKGKVIGEAWLLSDRKDHTSKVAEGELKGVSITQLMKEYHYEIMGTSGYHFENFPLLLKFLDCNEVLSVQVHPSDNQKEYLPKGESGKSEAWVVLDTDNNSRIYAGLKKGTTKEKLLKAISNDSITDYLHSFTPKKEDAIFIPSGTVHTLEGTVVFEIQENSDVTFRLYDWDRKDPKTGMSRELQIDPAIACINFNQTNIEPVLPKKSQQVENAEKLFDTKHFKLWRIKSESPLDVGITDEPTILVCLEGEATLDYNKKEYRISKGEVLLLPAIIGQQQLHPQQEITLLQIAISSIKPRM